MVATNKKLHEKAIRILEMIENVDTQIKNQIELKATVKPHFFYTAETCDKTIAWKKKVRTRLVRYYQATVRKIK